MHETHVTPLMYAAASGHVDALRLLLDVGKVDVNKLHTNGGSALLEATSNLAGNVGILHQNYFDKIDTWLSRRVTFCLLILRVLRYCILFT